MKKITIYYVLTLTLLAAVHMPLYGQNIIWIDSAFDSPRLVKTGADGIEQLSVSLPAGSQPQSIAYNADRDAILWSGLKFVDAAIRSVSTDFDSPSIIVDSQSVVRGLAVDAANNKIYWATTNLVAGPKIWRADGNGESPEALIDFGPGSESTPRAIALDVDGGKMYWTNFGEGKIQRANLTAGSAPEDILTGLKGPAGIAVDAEAGKIFWTEMYGHQIKSADLDGGNQAVLVSGLSYPNSITVNQSNNRMAWTEFTGKVKSAALDGSDIFDYGVNAIAPTGVVFESFPVSVQGSGEELYLPKEFALRQNYPNPFNPETQIAFDLPRNTRIKIEIYNMLGSRVRTLVDKEMQAGKHSIKWNGQNDFGGQAPSGVYFYRLTSAEFSQSRKMLLMR